MYDHDFVIMNLMIQDREKKPTILFVFLIFDAKMYFGFIGIEGSSSRHLFCLHWLRELTSA